MFPGTANLVIFPVSSPTLSYFSLSMKVDKRIPSGYIILTSNSKQLNWIQTTM